jgi:hypothetical protein
MICGKIGCCDSSPNRHADQFEPSNAQAGGSSALHPYQQEA